MGRDLCDPSAMVASRAALLLVAISLVVPACAARKAAWDSALADTECHAAHIVVKKKDDNSFLVTACGEEVHYWCDPEGGECSSLGPAGGVPIERVPTSPGAEAAEETEPVEDVEEPAAEEPEAAAAEPVSDEAAPDEGAADEAAADAVEDPAAAG